MPLEIFYDKIVIGSSLEAILFAYYNKYKVIYTRTLQPFSMERIENFGIGSSKKDAWDKYTFLLSLGGFIPFGQKIKHIRYESMNALKVISLEDNCYTIKFNNIFVFDDYNFLDLPPNKSLTNDECIVLDNFKYKSKSLDRENIEQKSKFLNQIIFDNNKTITTVSYSDINSVQKIPEHLVKIKTENIINEKNLILDHVSRNIINLGKNIYDDFDNVFFIYSDAKIIYNFYKKRSKIDYLKYLKLKLDL